MTGPNKNIKEERSVIFLHVPKAAGATLHGIIERQYRPTAIFTIEGSRVRESIDEFKRLPETRRKKIRVVKGHMGFGLHEFLPQPSTYITILRDPVDRVISHYYYALQAGPRHYLNNVIQNMSLEEYVSNEISPELDNGQTRLLSGIESVDTVTGFEQCSTEVLESAKKNLQEHFAVVGVSDRFDETLILLKKALGWGEVRYHRRNVTKNRPRKEDIPKSTLDLIEKFNELDIELFRYAREIFEESVTQQGPSFDKELEAFKSSNERWGRIHAFSISSFSHQAVRVIRRIKSSIRTGD